MQISRLFEIVYILMEKSVTAKELAARFEVSVRTIYRYIETLCQAGVPIYMTRGRGGGISLMKDYVLDKSLLSDDERKEILSALQSFKAADPDIDGVLKKMSSMFCMHDDSWISVDFSDWGNMHHEQFSLLKRAVIDRRVICFDYYNSAGKKTHRTAEPLQLWFKDKAWYLKAMCRQKQDFRIFKLSRIKNLVVTDESFETRAFNEHTSQEITYKLITLKLIIDGSQAYRVYDEFEQSEVHKKENGSFEVSVTFPEGDWVLGYILSFGDAIEVISPQYIRDAVKDKLQNALNKYS